MTEATRQNLLQGRGAYEAEVRGIAGGVKEKLANGETAESVARWANEARRAIGIRYKELTPETIRELIFQRNIAKYGDQFGPTFEYFLRRGYSYEQIMESAAKPDGGDFINLLLAPLQ